MVMPRVHGMAPRIGALILMLGGLACRDTPPKETANSAVAPAAATGAEPGSVPPDSAVTLAIGPLLLLPDPGGAPRRVAVIRTDALDETVGDTTDLGLRLTTAPFDLFTRGGSAGTLHLSGEVRSGAGSPDCTTWPVATLAADPAIPNWLVAVPSGLVTAMPLDSLDGVSPRDSAQWAAALTALASRLPDDTSRTFRARPYVVDRAWRLAHSQPSTIMATLIRRLNQEDAPREERLIIVVDAPTPDPRSWRVGWHERAEGEEDALEVAEPLLAFRSNQGGDLQLLFGRDDGEQLHAAILARTGDGWQLLWESARASCR